MSDLTGLPGTFAFVWDALRDGVARGTAPCRRAVLATVGDGGAARMVVLRGADEGAGSVEVHSDLRAAKVAELRGEPRATLVFWLPGAQVQIRAMARFQVLSGAAVADRWHRIPAGARRAYGGTPMPGAPLAQAEDHDATPGQAQFAVLIGRIDTIETLHLGPLHRRARFRRADGFAGGWIAP